MRPAGAVHAPATDHLANARSGADSTGRLPGLPAGRSTAEDIAMFWRMITRDIEDDGGTHRIRSVLTQSGHTITVSAREMPVNERQDSKDRSLQHMVAALPDLLQRVRSELEYHQSARRDIERLLAKAPKSRDLQEQLKQVEDSITEVEAVLARAAGRLS